MDILELRGVPGRLVARSYVTRWIQDNPNYVPRQIRTRSQQRAGLQVGQAVRHFQSIKHARKRHRRRRRFRLKMGFDEIGFHGYQPDLTNMKVLVDKEHRTEAYRETSEVRDHVTMTSFVCSGDVPGSDSDDASDSAPPLLDSESESSEPESSDAEESDDAMEAPTGPQTSFALPPIFTFPRKYLSSRLAGSQLDPSQQREHGSIDVSSVGRAFDIKRFPPGFPKPQPFEFCVSASPSGNVNMHPHYL